MNQKSKTGFNYESIFTERPLSEQGIDIHVYIVPLHLWRDHLRSADSQTVVTEAISAGFIRVMPNAIVNSLRIDIENQLGFETVPRNFIFLKCVGRCFTVTVAPEIFLMELTADIRPILASSQSNESHLKEARGHQKSNGHVTASHLRPNKLQSIEPPHLNDSRLSFGEEDEEEVEKEVDEEMHSAKVKRQLTITKASAAETRDYMLTPNSKSTQTMAEQDDDEEDKENSIRLKRREEEERRKEMLRRLALEQQREEQWKREEMARKAAERNTEEERRKKQEEELRKRLEEEEKLKLEEEERQWLEEVKRRQLDERKKQEEELGKRFEEEQRRRKEEEIRRKQEEELRKRQDERLKKSLEDQQKRMTDEELRRNLEEELRKKQDEEKRRKQEEEFRRKEDEERRRKQEEEFRRKEDEERRRKQEEEFRRKEDEERRRKQEEEFRRKEDEEMRRRHEEELRKKLDEEKKRKQENEQTRKQDMLNRKKEEEDRKRMTAEQQKAAEKAALLKEIERLREDRKTQELKKDELSRKVKDLQLSQSNAKDNWRKSYLEEKKKTPALNSDCTQLKKDLNAINRKILSNVESTSHIINHGPNQKPSEKSNLRIQAIRLRMEIEDLKSRLDNMNMKLTAELKLRTQAEEELQQYRKNQFARKKMKPLTLQQEKPNAGKGRGGGATGGGKAVGSQGKYNSMLQLPPVA